MNLFEELIHPSMLDDWVKRSSLRITKDECMTERIHPSLFVCSLPYKRDGDDCEWALASSNHSRFVRSVEPIFASSPENLTQ